MSSDFSKSVCFQNASVNRPHFGISGPTKMTVGYMNTDWVNPNKKFDVPSDVSYPTFPCQIFYQNQNNAKQMDNDCWKCIRGQILETVNRNTDRNTTSCIGNPCADLTKFSDDSLPPTSELCTWMSCVRNNRSTCTDDLYYSVFGNDANANSFSTTNCQK